MARPFRPRVRRGALESKRRRCHTQAIHDGSHGVTFSDYQNRYHASLLWLTSPWNRVCNFDQTLRAAEWFNSGSLFLPFPGGRMWTLSKNFKQMALEHSQMQSVILQRTAELQNLSQRLMKVQDEERRKLSRDLHDSTGQTLAALKISISFLQEHCGKDPSVTELFSDVTHLADQAIEEIRTMSYLLHPPLLDEVGFACAAEWYVEGFAKRSGISVKTDIVNTRARLPKNIEIALFRVLQESLTNIHRHAAASNAAILFQYDAEGVILEV